MDADPAAVLAHLKLKASNEIKASEIEAPGDPHPPPPSSSLPPELQTLPSLPPELQELLASLPPGASAAAWAGPPLRGENPGAHRCDFGQLCQRPFCLYAHPAPVIGATGEMPFYESVRDVATAKPGMLLAAFAFALKKKKVSVPSSVDSELRCSLSALRKAAQLGFCELREKGTGVADEERPRNARADKLQGAFQRDPNDHADIPDQNIAGISAALDEFDRCPPRQPNKWHKILAFLLSRFNVEVDRERRLYRLATSLPPRHPPTVLQPASVSSVASSLAHPPSPPLTPVEKHYLLFRETHIGFLYTVSDDANHSIGAKIVVGDTVACSPPSTRFRLLPFYPRHDPKGDMASLLKYLRDKEKAGVVSLESGASSLLLLPMTPADRLLVENPDGDVDGFRLHVATEKRPASPPLATAQEKKKARAPQASIVVRDLNFVTLRTLKALPVFRNAAKIQMAAENNAAEVLFDSAEEARRVHEECRWGGGRDQQSFVRIHVNGKERDLALELVDGD
ncbi:hypothetical protein TeGR_g4508 [Tetraparma gracilis]|uniref:Uncharacterized protein n=1 Tax=Tetraparma gracilis TaxID=2962635 RepID=A0ABQ6MJW2_9STRA|nr:hypothetical protein TeGR_g4508 [Tetraparma gracilis]